MPKPTPMATRSLAGAALVLASFTLAPQAQAAAPLDLATPDGAVAAARKIQCSMKDGQAVVYWWIGDLYSRVPGERDRALFRVEGMNVRQCDTLTDPVRGVGFRYVSREVMFYEDPATGAILKTWKNPWTGEDLEVIPVANDPVNAREPTFAVGRDGGPYKWRGRELGNHWWTTDTIPLFYDNPLAGGYQEYIGGKYHATEMFNSFGDLDDLRSPKIASARVRIGWVRISGWLPWMKMGDRAGELYFHAAGEKLAGFEQLPAAMQQEIRSHYPDWTAPPPLDDTRPNETSWSYFKKKVAPKGPPPH